MSIQLHERSITTAPTLPVVVIAEPIGQFGITCSFEHGIEQNIELKVDNSRIIECNSKKAH